MRILLGLMGYLIAIPALIGMIAAPFWNLHLTNKRIKEINKNR